jgi:hypothetical protein
MRDKPIRDALLRGLGALGLHSVKRIDRASLNGLIRALHPIDSGHELIRIGPDGDGGYLVPDELDGIAYAFSPGVSNESGFEAALADRGMRVFLADYSVDGPAEPNPSFVFEKKFVGSFADATHVTLDQWKQAAIGDYSGDLLLQMDIEGAEFETLISTSDALMRQFRILIVEFHYLHQLWNKPWFVLVKRAFEKLLSTHSVVHIHPNNCCGSFKSRGLELPRVAEFTFLRNDRVTRRDYARVFPHPLDRDNTRKPTLSLPDCWHR